MAATGILWDAVNATKTALVALNLGYEVVTDPRNARPMTLFLELPTVEAFTYNVGDITLRIRVCAPPPGNQDASDCILKGYWQGCLIFASWSLKMAFMRYLWK